MLPGANIYLIKHLIQYITQLCTLSELSSLYRPLDLIVTVAMNMQIIGKQQKWSKTNYNFHGFANVLPLEILITT